MIVLYIYCNIYATMGFIFDCYFKIIIDIHPPLLLPNILAKFRSLMHHLLTTPINIDNGESVLHFSKCFCKVEDGFSKFSASPHALWPSCCRFDNWNCFSYMKKVWIYHRFTFYSEWFVLLVFLYIVSHGTFHGTTNFFTQFYYLFKGSDCQSSQKCIFYFSC